MRTKLRRAADGNVIDRTFRAGEKFRLVHTESQEDAVPVRGRQRCALHGHGVLRADRGRRERAWRRRCAGCKPSSEVDVLFIDEQPADVQLPSAVDLEVTQTDPGVRGDSVSSGGTKPATLETGAVDPGARCSSSRASASAWTRARATTSRAPRMRRSEQRRAAVIALYQHDLTGRPLAEVVRGPRLAVRAGARARGRRPRGGARRGDRPPRARVVGGADPAARAEHHAGGADRDAPPRRGRRPRRRSRPRGRSRRRWKAQRCSAARTPPGFVNGVLAAALREVRENAQIP